MWLWLVRLQQQGNTLYVIISRPKLNSCHTILSSVWIRHSSGCFAIGVHCIRASSHYTAVIACVESQAWTVTIFCALHAAPWSDWRNLNIQVHSNIPCCRLQLISHAISQSAWTDWSNCRSHDSMYDLSSTLYHLQPMNHNYWLKIGTRGHSHDTVGEARFIRGCAQIDWSLLHTVPSCSWPIHLQELFCITTHTYHSIISLSIRFTRMYST